MKKLSAVSIFLCLVMLLQALLVPAFATEADPTDASIPETLPSAVDETAPQVEFGTATIMNGCRTLNAQMPLGGSDRKVESAVSAFVYERNTGTVVYSYSPDLIVQPGTFAKLVACIVAIENGNLDEMVKCNSMSYRSLPFAAKNSKLKEAEELTLRDLLYCLILEWANDAAVTIAEHVGGTQDNFVKMMNDWAQKAGCTNTVFSDCHGLGSEGQATTARDVARIVEVATKNETFREIFGANSYTIQPTNKTEEKRALKSLNYLKEDTIAPQFNYQGVTGGIAHYTESSGASLVCTAEKSGMSYTIVVMGCERKMNEEKTWVVERYGNYDEAWDLLEFAFDNYKICRLLHDGQSMTQFDVVGGENDVVAQSHTSMDAILPINARLDNLIMKYTVQNGSLKAPIAQDEKIGQLQIWYRTSCIVETELYAMSSVRSVEKSELNIRSTATRDDSNLSGFLSFIGIVCLVILVPFVAYLMINNLRRMIARNRRRRRRASRRRSR